jgi:tetratricopeptide (TPR) repeat protein
MVHRLPLSSLRMYIHSWNWPRLCTFGMFLLAVVLYMGGLSPTIYWRDASEFVTVAHDLGISHPAGSPTYALLAKLATFMPIGSVALRVNLVSALMAGLTVSLLFSLLYNVLPASPSGARLAASLAGAFFLLLSESFWRFAEAAEVYSLQDCLIVALIVILLQARQATFHPPARIHPTQLYYIFAFLYGLSAGVHATMAFCAPAFLLFIWLTNRRLFWGRELAFLALFFLLGLAVYLYLPVRSLANPAFDWGDPQTWQQFWAHITDRKDSSMYLAFPWAKLPYQIHIYFVNLINEFSIFGVILGLLGIGYLLYQDKQLSLLFGLIFFGNVSFFIRSWTAAFGFIPSFIIFSIWIGFGVCLCIKTIKKIFYMQNIFIPRYTIYGCFFLSIIITLSGLFTTHISKSNLTNNYSAEIYGKQLLDQLPTNAILFGSYSWFPLTYLQKVEQRRPDLTVFLQGEIIRPDFFSYPSKDRFPNVLFSETGHVFTASTKDYFWLFSKMNHKDHPIFWDPDPFYKISINNHLIPKGLLFSFNPFKETEYTRKTLNRHYELLTDSAMRILQESNDIEALKFIASRIYYIGIHFKRINLINDAANMYRLGITLNPDDVFIRNAYGEVLASQGKYKQALEQFELGFRSSPISQSINRNLGAFSLSFGENEKAIYHLNRALLFGEPSADVYALLAEAHIRQDRYSAAKKALQSALKLYQDLQRITKESDRPNDAMRHLIDKTAWVKQTLHYLEQGDFEALIPLAQMWTTSLSNGNR